MKPLPMIVLGLLVSAVAAADAPRLEQLDWMAGCWGFERDGKRYEEIWMAPAAGGAMGMARTVKDGRTVNHEFTRLVERDGVIAYVANPSGQNAASFPLKSLDGTRAVFENLEHDFPTRIIYEYKPPDRLDARAEGTLKDKPAGFDYPFGRVKCPGEPTFKTQ